VEVLNCCSDPEHVAAPLFLLIDWNLISRADGVIAPNIKLIRMWIDALHSEIRHNKTDQN
jgi:hypothetical protein